MMGSDCIHADGLNAVHPSRDDISSSAVIRADLYAERGLPPATGCAAAASLAAWHNETQKRARAEQAENLAAIRACLQQDKP